jgi:hypothetical protein
VSRDPLPHCSETCERPVGHFGDHMLFGGCEHAYPPGEYCPACGDVPVPDDDSEDEGDEMVCDRCTRRHGVVWFAPSDIWNAVMRRDGVDEFPFCCPACFMALAGERGVATTGWLVTPFDDGPVTKADQVVLRRA